MQIYNLEQAAVKSAPSGKSSIHHDHAFNYSAKVLKNCLTFWICAFDILSFYDVPIRSLLIRPNVKYM